MLFKVKKLFAVKKIFEKEKKEEDQYIKLERIKIRDITDIKDKVVRVGEKKEEKD